MNEPIGIYDFNERLQFSRGIRERCDVDTIISMIPGAVSCVKTEAEQDRRGVDYVVTLRRGARVLIDAKGRDYNERRPASSFWQDEPDLALEIWSDVARRTTGWTLNEASNVDLILFTFDPRDTVQCYLLGFQTLRAAFRANLEWWRQRYKPATQKSFQEGRCWFSQCIFVPVSEVQEAMVRVTAGRLQIEPTEW